MTRRKWFPIPFKFMFRNMGLFPFVLVMQNRMAEFICCPEYLTFALSFRIDEIPDEG